MDLRHPDKLESLFVRVSTILVSCHLYTQGRTWCSAAYNSVKSASKRLVGWTCPYENIPLYSMVNTVVFWNRQILVKYHGMMSHYSITCCFEIWNGLGDSILGHQLRVVHLRQTVLNSLYMYMSSFGKYLGCFYWIHAILQMCVMCMVCVCVCMCVYACVCVRRCVRS